MDIPVAAKTGWPKHNKTIGDNKDNKETHPNKKEKNMAKAAINSHKNAPFSNRIGSI
jgi:hypothetical protein